MNRESTTAASGLPTASDFIAYARLMNGTCPACGTINKYDGSPRCDCATKEAETNG